MSIEVSDVQTHRINYITGNKDVASGVAVVFGEMVKLAVPIMEAYLCDLYYDAVWMNDCVKGESFTFYWSLNSTGTNIGRGEDTLSREHNYRLTVRCEDGTTTLQVETLSS